MQASSRAPVEKFIWALANARRWRNESPSELERLARSGRRLLYAPNEPIALPRDLGRAVAVLVSGKLRLSDSGVPTPAWIDPPVQQVQQMDPTSWEIETLLEVEAQLSQAIGPYARLAVRRAARGTADLPNLYRSVAGLIEDTSSREEFLRLRPRNEIRDFGTGTALIGPGDGQHWDTPAGTLVALGQAELLAVLPHELKELSHDRSYQPQR